MSTLHLTGVLGNVDTLSGSLAETYVGLTGTNDYDELENKPQINNIELKGNISTEDLGIQREMESLSNLELEAILK